MNDARTRRQALRGWLAADESFQAALILAWSLWGLLAGLWLGR